MVLAQWSICVGIAASLVVVEELIKLVLRLRRPPGLEAWVPQQLPVLQRHLSMAQAIGATLR